MAITSPLGRLAASVLFTYLMLVGHASFSTGTEAEMEEFPKFFDSHLKLGAPKPHIVFVHGSFEGAWIWYKVATLLQQKGFKTTAVDLLSMGINSANPDEVANLEQFASPLIETLSGISEKVVLVAHSFGGVSQSLAMEYFPSKIVKAIYLSAIMPKDGDNLATGPLGTVLSTLAAKNAVTPVYGDDPSTPTSLTVGPNSSALIEASFALAQPRDVTLTLLLVTPQPAGPALGIVSLSKSRYGRVPRYYIRTKQDLVVTPELQDEILKNNPPKGVFWVDADHGSFFSRSIEVATTIDYIIGL